jgi:hypothetical protein
MVINEKEWGALRAQLEQSTSLSPSRVILTWLALNKPLPAPSVYKQAVIRAYAQQYGISTLVETGTYLGQMVEASLPHFSEIHSVELSEELHANAVRHFKSHKQVKLHQGDSGTVLPKILKRLRKPALFWLDAHYSEGVTAKGDTNTPIVEELEALLSHRIKQHVILIDDARIFNGRDDYPTIAKVKKIVLEKLPNYHLVLKDDIICIQPDDRNIDI